MSAFVLLPWGNAFLQLTEAEFTAAMARGLAPGPNAGGAAPPLADEQLLDSRAMGERLGVTAEWCEAAARAGDIPSLRLGRYLRFRPSAVIASLDQHRHADR